MGLSQIWYDSNKEALNLLINPLDANGDGTGKRDIVNLLSNFEDQLKELRNSIDSDPQVLTNFDK